MSTMLIVLSVIIVFGGITALIFMWVLRSGMFHSHLMPGSDAAATREEDIAAIESMASEAAAKKRPGQRPGFRAKRGLRARRTSSDDIVPGARDACRSTSAS